MVRCFVLHVVKTMIVISLQIVVNPQPDLRAGMASSGAHGKRTWRSHFAQNMMWLPPNNIYFTLQPDRICNWINFSRIFIFNLKKTVLSFAISWTSNEMKLFRQAGWTTSFFMHSVVPKQGNTRMLSPAFNVYPRIETALCRAAHQWL